MISGFSRHASMPVSEIYFPNQELKGIVEVSYNVGKFALQWCKTREDTIMLRHHRKYYHQTPVLFVTAMNWVFRLKLWTVLARFISSPRHDISQLLAPDCSLVKCVAWSHGALPRSTPFIESKTNIVRHLYGVSKRRLTKWGAGFHILRLRNILSNKL